MNFKSLDNLLEHLTSETIIPCISIAIGLQDRLVHSSSFGMIPETNIPVSTETRFDIASLTKVLSGICFMQLVEQGYLSLNDPICNLFPEFNTTKPIEKNGKRIDTCDASKITWRHALTHTSGMGWTRPTTIPSLPHLDKGFEDIFQLPFATQPDTHIIYSDILIILMGRAIEIITEKPLDIVVQKQLCLPLSLHHTAYLRRSLVTDSITANIAPTEFDTHFRQRRICGEVHDENAWLMDGVAAHAGIFSTAEDMCHLALAYARCLSAPNSGHNILSKQTVEEMILVHASDDDGERRGILWQLSGRSEQAYTRFLSSHAYGHAGFTGCFLWNDPVTNLSVVLLSNDVYNGREHRKLFEVRSEIMRLIVSEIRP